MDNPHTTCQWIGTEDKGPVYTSHCDCAVVPGRAYCEEHLWAVYQKGTAVHRRKDRRRAEAIWDLESEFNRAVEELIEEGFEV